METRFAKTLSYILHPLLIPVYAVLLLLNMPFVLSYSLTTEFKFWLTGLVLVFTFLMPVIAILTLRYFNVISSLELEKQQERTYPLILTSASYMALFYLLRGSGLPPYFLYIIYGALFTLISGMLINLVYKISLHTLSWGAAVASSIGISVKLDMDILPVIVSAILVSGLAGYARLKLNAHNATQVYLGFVAGAGIMFFLTFAF